MNIRLGLFILVGFVAQNTFSMSPDQIRRSKDMINTKIKAIENANGRIDEARALLEQGMSEAKNMEKMGISSKNLQLSLDEAFADQLRAYLNSPVETLNARIAALQTRHPGRIMTVAEKGSITTALNQINTKVKNFNQYILNKAIYNDLRGKMGELRMKLTEYSNALIRHQTINNDDVSGLIDIINDIKVSLNTIKK